MLRRIAILFGCLVGSAWAPAAEKIDFNFEVRPLLSDRCFFCHGPDPKNRKKDLRLDTREGALSVIKPGDPDGSELIERIVTNDPDEVMPPPASHLELSEAERGIIRRWIAEGADYKGHWAFETPAVKPAHPTGTAPTMGAGKVNEIDGYVLERLERQGLGFNRPAEKARLLRRVSFDLTGLPPTPAELDAFEADTSPDAYERQVDRLLASPHFGERMAADWLDVARFADTFGYQSDVNSPVWPYRDWVIVALNENKPYDRFIVEQLAGDLLPNPTRDQRIATAFNRLHRQTNEGGSINEEFRVEYVCDRVETVGTAFLGLTMQCAKCHDHKYDPLTAKDFYQMFAFFQNIDESGLYSHFTDAIPTPTLALPSDGQEQAAALADAKVVRLEASMALLRDERRAAFDDWRKTVAAPGSLPVSKPIGDFSFDEIAGGKLANRANEKEPGKAFDDLKTAPGKVGQALLLSGENNANFALGGGYTRDDAFSFSFWMQTPDVKDRAVVFHRSKAWTDAASCGYELLIEEGRLSGALIHFWPGNALRVVAKKPLPPNEWTHVVWSYDGSSHAAGLRLFVNGTEAECDVVRDCLTKDINRGGENRLTIGQRFRDRGFKNGLVDEFQIFDRALTAWEARRLATGSAAAPSDAALFEYYLATVDEPYRTAAAELKAARQARSAATDPVPEIMTMKELPQPKPAFILFRGKYDEPRDRVTADTPTFLGPLPPDAPKNRLGFARWLVDAKHPLTSRVLVNRLWQSLFGHGLVGTPEDFGQQGQLPSHPELLDFLARRFVDGGWDFKGLVRLMVTSATYRQDTAVGAAVRARDPENRWLSRGPKVRLSAEQLRDQALLLAGVLDRKIGGPSVNPDTTNRRSVYTFWKRTMPDVRMEIFDMAKREVCVARRQQTNTPLQALTLMNEAKFVEFSRAIARNALKAFPGDPAARTAAIFRQMTSRPPLPAELTILNRLFEEQRAAANGDELQATTAVANALLSFDEAVTK